MTAAVIFSAYEAAEPRCCMLPESIGKMCPLFAYCTEYCAAALASVLGDRCRMVDCICAAEAPLPAFASLLAPFEGHAPTRKDGGRSAAADEDYYACSLMSMYWYWLTLGCPFRRLAASNKSLCAARKSFCA